MFRVFFATLILLTGSKYLRAESIPENVISAWKAAHTHLTNINGIFAIKEGSSPPDQVTFAFQNDLGKSEVSTQAKDGVRRIAALRTRKFEFGLSEASPERWQLSRVYEREDGSPLLTAHENIVRIAFGAYLECSLIDAIESGDFIVKNWTQDEGSASFVLQRAKEDGKHHFDKLFVQLDPKHSYRVVEAGLAMNNQNNGLPISRLEYEYEDEDSTIGEQFIPRKCSLKTLEGGNTIFKYTFSDLSTDPLPEDEFTLAHYGLPEYTGASSNPMMFYLAVCMGIGLVLAFANYFKKRNS